MARPSARRLPAAGMLTALLTASLVLAGCLNGTFGGTDKVTVSAPTWTTGDLWAYQAYDGGALTGNFLVTIITDDDAACPSGTGTCYEVERYGLTPTGTIQLIDVVHVGKSDLSGFPIRFPLSPGNQWTAQDYQLCAAREPASVTVPAGTFATLPSFCTNGDGTSEVFFYSPDARNSVKVSALAGGQETPLLELVKLQATLLALVYETAGVEPPAPATDSPTDSPGTGGSTGNTGGNTGGTDANGGATSATAPAWRLGDVWEYTVVDPATGATGTLVREVTAVNVPCGAYRCYEVTTTLTIEGYEPEVSISYYDMTTLNKVRDGTRGEDAHFPLRAGDEWSYSDFDGSDNTCEVLPLTNVDVGVTSFHPVFPVKCAKTTEDGTETTIAYYAPELGNFVRVDALESSDAEEGVTIVLIESAGNTGRTANSGSTGSGSTGGSGGMGSDSETVGASGVSVKWDVHYVASDDAWTFRILVINNNRAPATVNLQGWVNDTWASSNTVLKSTTQPASNLTVPARTTVLHVLKVLHPLPTATGSVAADLLVTGEGVRTFQDSRPYLNGASDTTPSTGLVIPAGTQTVNLAQSGAYVKWTTANRKSDDTWVFTVKIYNFDETPLGTFPMSAEVEEIYYRTGASSLHKETSEADITVGARTVKSVTFEVVNPTSAGQTVRGMLAYDAPEPLGTNRETRDYMYP